MMLTSVRQAVIWHKSNKRAVLPFDVYFPLISLSQWDILVLLHQKNKIIPLYYYYIYELTELIDDAKIYINVIIVDCLVFRIKTKRSLPGHFSTKSLQEKIFHIYF